MSLSVALFIDEVSENAIHLLCVMSKDFVRHSFILKLRLMVHLRPVYCSCGESQGEAQSGGGSLYLLPSSMLMLRCWIIIFSKTDE